MVKDLKKVDPDRLPVLKTPTNQAGTWWLCRIFCRIHKKTI